MVSATRDATSSILQVFAPWTETPVAWPGKHFDPPDGAWVRLTIQWGDGFAQTLDGTNEVIGILLVDVFAKPGRGEGEAYGLADQVRDLINRKIAGTVHFDPPSGPLKVPESEWIHLQITCGFSVDEKVAV